MTNLHIADWTPQALSIAIALGEKGIDFTVENHDWRAIPIDVAAFTATLEPANTLEGEFPILVDGGKPMSDSYFVLEYIDDAYSEPPLKPADAYGQWRLQALTRFLGERAAPALCSLGVARRFAGDAGDGEAVLAFAQSDVLPPERRQAWVSALSEPASAETVEESQRKASLFLERLESELGASGGPWLMGDRFTLADIAAVVLALPLLDGTLGGDFAAGAKVHEWLQRVRRRPAVQAALAVGGPAFLPGPEHARWG